MKPDAGTHALSLISKLSPHDAKSIYEVLLSCLKTSCVYSIKNLPISNQVVKDCRFLQPFLQQKKAGVNALSRLSLEIGQALGNDAIQQYFGPKIKTKYDLCDKVMQEYTLYQLEKIPESFIKNPEVVKKSRN